MRQSVKEVMKEHRVETRVSGDGSIMLQDLPFAHGEEVEVVVVSRRTELEVRRDREHLLGSVRKFDQPFEAAVDIHDWDTM